MHKYIFESIDEIDRQIEQLSNEAKKSKDKKRVNEIIKELAELNAEKERRQIEFEEGYCYENKEEEIKIEKETIEEIQNKISERIRRLNQLEKELGTIKSFKQRKEILIKEQETIKEFNKFMNEIIEKEEIWKRADENFKRKLIKDRNKLNDRHMIINSAIRMIEEEQYKTGEEKEERIQN